MLKTILKMLSLPNLGRSAEGFWVNNSTLPPKNREETFHRRELICETQIDAFNLIPLKNGNEATDSSQRPVSGLSLVTGDQQEYVRNGELLGSKANVDVMTEEPTSSITLDSVFKLNLGSQGGRNTRIKKPLDRYFASVEKEILSRQRYDSRLSSILGPEERKTAAKNKNFGLLNDFSQVNDKINKRSSVTTKGKHTLEFTVEPTSKDSYHGNVHHIQYGDMFRALLHRTERQHKEKSKLIHDNAIAEQKLKEANIIIDRLKEKIQRRRLILKSKEESQRSLEEDIELLKKERDEKQAECTKIITQLNTIMEERRGKVDDLAKRQLKSEASYHQELQNNTELKARLESKERHIKALREKVEKARKWKNDVA